MLRNRRIHQQSLSGEGMPCISFPGSTALFFKKARLLEGRPLSTKRISNVLTFVYAADAGGEDVLSILCGL
jgi:hypothetical protein